MEIVFLMYYKKRVYNKKQKDLIDTATRWVRHVLFKQDSFPIVSAALQL